MPADPQESVTGKRTPGYHAPDCKCLICARTAAARAAGKPSRKKKKAIAGKNREESRKATAAIEASIKTQVELGRAPNVALAGRIAGVSERTAQLVSNANDFVQTALANAGITENFLAELAKEGMGAFTQKIITDNDGNIVDVVNMPDWRNRHAFWRDILMAKKILGAEMESAAMGGGGLILITPDAAKIIPGHPPACVCEDCRAAWEEKTKYLRAASIRDRAIDAIDVSVSAQNSPARPQDVVVEDDFTPEE